MEIPGYKLSLYTDLFSPLSFVLRPTRLTMKNVVPNVADIAPDLPIIELWTFHIYRLFPSLSFSLILQLCPSYDVTSASLGLDGVELLHSDFPVFTSS